MRRGEEKKLNICSLGTDATIADHIKKILDREYAVKMPDGGGEAVFKPSTLGIALVEGYDRIGFEMSLSKPLLRAEVS